MLFGVPRHSSFVFVKPKSRRRRRRRRLRVCLRLIVATPHVVPPPPLVLSVLRRLLSADASPPFCLLYASPPVCLLFARWLSHRPCCRATADSTLRLCLNLFYPIWLLQLTMPHLSRHRRCGACVGGAKTLKLFHV